MTVRGSAIRTFVIGGAALMSLLCMATTAMAGTQPNFTELETSPDVGMAPTIATAITIGLVAIATVARAARNYIIGKEMIKTNGRAPD